MTGASSRPRTLAALVPLALLWAGACTGRLEFDPRIGEASAADARGTGGAAAAPAGGSGGSWSPAGGAGSGGAGGGTSSGSGGYGSSGGEPGYPMTDARADSWGSATGAAGTGGGDGGVAALDGAMSPVASACPQGYDVLDLVFNRKCGGCHGAAAPSKNLDLVSTGIGARMVNKVSTCMGKPLISSQRPAGGKPTGLLFDKLAGPVTGCGVRMPAGAPPLTPVELACVEEWAVGAINKALGIMP